MGFWGGVLGGFAGLLIGRTAFSSPWAIPTLAMASPGEQTESPLKAGVAVLANRILYCACISALSALAAPLLLAEEPPRIRRAFATAMNLVQEGM